MMKRYIGLACFAAVCICAGCEDLSVDCVLDETKCENGNEVKCVDGRWKVTDQACTPGDSQPATPCETGQVQCDGNILKTCVDGSWNAGTPCGEGQTCADNACKPAETAGCEPDTKKCEDNILKKCVDGSWDAGTPCGDGQTCVDNECKPADAGVCTEGSSDCEDEQVKLCINGHYHSILDCKESGQTCIKDESGRASCSHCTEGNTRCKDDKTVQECTAGKWVDTECTGNLPVCKISEAKASCQPECSKGETVCEGNSVKECKDDSTWQKNECENNQFCGIISMDPERFGCRDCIENEERCRVDANGNYIISKCTNGRPEDVSNCSDSNQYCNTDSLAPSCKADCEKGAIQCNNENALKECDTNGHWKKADIDLNCKEDETCYIIDEPEGQKTPVCKQCEPNALIQCVGTQYRQCKNYRWTDSADCELANGESHCETIEGEDKCVQCEPGKTKCETNTLYRCNDSHLWEVLDCGDKKCGKPELDNPPEDGNEPFMCYECEKGETKCDGNILMTCLDGSYKDKGNKPLSPTDCKDSKKVCTLNVADNIYECMDNCEIDSLRCHDSSDGTKSIVEKCVKGENETTHYILDQDCSSNDMTCQELGAGETLTHRCECKTDSTRCHDDGTGKMVPQRCIGNNWKDIGDENQKDSICGINPDTGEYTWVAKCTHDVCDSKDLAQHSIYRCTEGKYNKEACPETTPFCNNTTITEGEVLGACNLCLNGAKNCNGNKLQTCEDGKWNEGIACPSSTPYCGTIDGGKSYQCLVCESDYRQCLNLVAANNVRFVALTTCDNTGNYNYEQCSNACGIKNSILSCISLNEAQDGDICDSNAAKACTSNTSRVECDNGQVKHINCQKGEYSEYKICSANKNNYCYVTIINAHFQNDSAYIRENPKDSDPAKCTLNSKSEYHLAHYGETEKDGMTEYLKIIVTENTPNCPKGTVGWIKRARFSVATTWEDILE